MVHQNSDLAYNLATRSKRTSGWAARASRADPGGDRRPRRPRRDRARNCAQRHRADRRHALPQRGGHAGDLHPQGARRHGDAGIAGEVIVADNGSTDGSAGDRAQPMGARVVPVADEGLRQRADGRHRAPRAGSYVIMGDADDSYDFGEIPKFVEQLREGYDLVQGCRLPVGRRTRPARRDAVPAPLVGQPDVLADGAPLVPRADPRRLLRPARLHQGRSTTGSTSAAPGWSSPPR